MYNIKVRPNWKVLIRDPVVTLQTRFVFGTQSELANFPLLIGDKGIYVKAPGKDVSCFLFPRMEGRLQCDPPCRLRLDLDSGSLPNLARVKQSRVPS